MPPARRRGPARASLRARARGTRVTLLARLRWALTAALAVWLAGAALAPLGEATRERSLDFPPGAAGRRAVPAELRLTLGVNDVLLLRNRDRVPHVFGQVLVAPGHEFRLPFEQAGRYPFACDLAPGMRVTVQVLPEPDPGWQRLRWRLQGLFEAVHELPLQGPED
jgi:hypothetical protein